MSAIPDILNAGISVVRGDTSGAGLSIAAAVPVLGTVANAARVARAARAGARYSDDLVKVAQKRFPGKASKIENHHVEPKYLGGAASGRTVPVDAAYHQQITNEFRRLWPYGQGTPSAQQLERIMQQVYDKYPLPEM